MCVHAWMCVYTDDGMNVFENMLCMYVSVTTSHACCVCMDTRKLPTLFETRPYLKQSPLTLTHSLTPPSLWHSFTQPLTLIHSDPLTHSFTHSPSSTHSFTHSHTHIHTHIGYRRHIWSRYGRYKTFWWWTIPGFHSRRRRRRRKRWRAVLCTVRGRWWRGFGCDRV